MEIVLDHTTSERAVRRLACLLLAAAGVISLGLPAEAKQRCTDFSAYGNLDPLPKKLKQDKYTFNFGSPSLVSLGGANFWSSGVSIKTPKPATSVDLDVFAGAGFDIVATGYNAAGGVEDTVIIPINYLVNSVSLSSAVSPIVEVTLEQGGNESNIQRVCTNF